MKTIEQERGRPVVAAENREAETGAHPEGLDDRMSLGKLRDDGGRFFAVKLDGMEP